MDGTNMHKHHIMPKMENDSTDMKMKMNGTGGMDMMMMQMYFVVSSKVTLLFKEWHTTNSGEMIGSCIALFVTGILYEGLKTYRQKMLLRPLQKLQVDSNHADGSELKFIRNTEKVSWKRFTSQHIIQSLLHMVQVFIGYVLMLAVMTYNVWVCIAVVLGAGCGYFIFDAQPMLLNSDHCN